MTTAQNYINSENSVEQKVILLDFMIQVIKNDLQTSTLAATFYEEQDFSPHQSATFFPMICFDKQGNRTSTYKLTQKGRRIVNLSEDCIFVTPWSPERLQGSIIDLFTNSFDFVPTNHFSTYYKPLGICRIESGCHSISAGIGYKNGEILSKEVDITHCFSHITTDGAYWYSTHTNERLSGVLDFRVAIIYEVTKLKFELINKTVDKLAP